MNLKLKALRGSALLGICEAINYGASLIRNIILARLITKADFGIAATFAMVMTLLELSSRLGVGRLIVREKDGARPEFIATAHTVLFITSLLSAVLIGLAAWPAAMIFDLGGHVEAFFWLATIPLISSLSHLDVKRFERELKFGKAAMADMVPQVIITLVAYPISVWLADYRVVIVLLILKSTLTVVGTHLLAERPYLWRMERHFVMRMLGFGWPLVVTGYLTFFVMRGDQFIVATLFTMSDLGAYAAAASLAMVPTLFFTRIFGGVMLPIMAGVQDDAVAFERRYRLAVAVISAFSAAYAAFVIIGAEAIMTLAFGRKYLGSGIILASLAGVNAFRNLRLATTIAAMAKGDSVNQMVSNLWGSTSLIAAIGVAAAGQPVWVVAVSGLIGEALAGLASILRLRRRDGVPVGRSLFPASLVAANISFAIAVSLLFGTHGSATAVALIVALAGGAFSGAFLIATLSDTRRETMNAMQLIKRLGWRSVLIQLKGSRA